jgi:hypothetical protein
MNYLNKNALIASVFRAIAPSQCKEPGAHPNNNQRANPDPEKI